jgi:hypothetical protein
VSEHQQHNPLPRGPKYDEHLALQRLEQLRRDIQTARWRREQAAAEFDAFIASFREPAASRVPSPAGRLVRGAPSPQTEASPPASVPAPPAHEATAPDAPPVVEPAVETDQVIPEVAAPVAAAPATEPGTDPLPPAFPAEPAALTLKARKNTANARRIAAAAAVGAVALAGFMMLRGRDGSSRESSVPRADAALAAAPSQTAVPRTPDSSIPAPAAPEAQAQASSVAPPPGTVRLELVALRPVWIRVTVDGRRRIEREVPQGFRATLDAERAIAIRAGNAGAVMVGANGAAPAPLGREGQVATRIFPTPNR